VGVLRGAADGQRAPGTAHVWARAYKDLFCRYRTMRGYYVARKAGWDTHGLPVEVEVEKRLGITSKRQIEDEVGIAEFTRLCRESVLSLCRRLACADRADGYWVDLDAAYWTFDSSYVESVWWHLSRLFEQGLLYEDVKVVPYCPRCGHGPVEPRAGPARRLLRRNRRVRLRAAATRRRRPRRPLGATSLVVWTTTPWTLLSNTGAAVNPELTYAVVDGMVVAEALVEDVFARVRSSRAA